ncbi:MAG: polysaccharide pyruvyl transferase family protein [Solirubrobacteraceae bacterium]
MNTVLLAGAFGQHNPGDEALLRAFVRALPGDGLVVTSSDPVATEAEHGVQAVPARDRRAVARALGSADGVVFAGGTIFKALHPISGRRPLSLLRSALGVATAANAMRTPLAMVGVGAGRISGRRARAMTRALVRRADLLILRDEESARVLADAGAPAPFRVGADAAWTTLEAPAGPAEQGDAVIVALSAHAGGRGLARRLALVLAPVARAGLRVRLQPWQPGEDVALARAVAGALEGSVEIVPAPADLDDARRLFGGARLVLALRFHALLAAAAAGVPVAALAHEPKLAGLGRRLDQTVLAPTGAPETLGRAILAAADRPAASVAAVAREIERAEQGMALLRVLLSGGRSAEAAAVAGLDLAPEAHIR